MILLPLVITLDLSLAQVREVARARWGTPSCGEPALIAETTDPWQRPDYLAWVLVEPQSDNTLAPVECVIHYIPTRIPPGRTCETLVHEWGHVTGHGHSDDPDNIMYPYPTKLPLQECHPTTTIYVSFKQWDNVTAVSRRR